MMMMSNYFKSCFNSFVKHQVTNSRIANSRSGRFADWTSRGLVNSRAGKSRTGQVADATGDFACFVFVFWPFIDVFLRVYLSIHYASDSVSCIMST